MTNRRPAMLRNVTLRNAGGFGLNKTLVRVVMARMVFDGQTLDEAVQALIEDKVLHSTATAEAVKRELCAWLEGSRP
jgi:hypothetical protein